MSVPQDEHDVVALAPGQRELTGFTEALVPLMGVPELRDTGCRGALGIIPMLGVVSMA